MKKLFFLDYKTIDEFGKLPEDTNSVLNILKRYSLEIGDYEKNGFTKAIFNSLGWNTQFRDTIFSFHRIICKTFEVYSNENEIKLR